MDKMYEAGVKKSHKDCKKKKKGPTGITESQLKTEMVQKSMKRNMARWRDDLTHIKTSLPGNPVDALMVGMSHKLTEKLLSPSSTSDPFELGDSRGRESAS